VSIRIQVKYLVTTVRNKNCIREEGKLFKKFLLSQKAIPHFLNNRLKDGREVVSHVRRPPFPPRKFTATQVDSKVTVLLEGLGQLKNPVTSSVIESATFRLVV
jgi:hypothetical protein